MKRLRGVMSINLEGLNLGPHDQLPVLLTDLLANCPLLHTVNLYKCYCSSSHFGINHSRKGLVEQTLLQHRPVLSNLCIEASSAGLKKIVHGLTSLKSLHLMANCDGINTDITNSALLAAFGAASASSDSGVLPQLTAASLCGLSGVTSVGVLGMLKVY